MRTHRSDMRRAARAAVLSVLALLLPGWASAQSAQSGAGAADDSPGVSTEWLVATAVLALPREHRAGAEVRAWTGDGDLVVLREGSNGLICLADRPGDGRFSAACYHDSLEPFMARGRELAAAGVEGMDRQERRWQEAREGTLPVPEQAAMVFNLGFPTEEIDPATADPATGTRLHAVYMPYATAESTGLPTSGADGGPWLMFPGTPSAHVMVFVPGRQEEAGG